MKQVFTSLFLLTFGIITLFSKPITLDVAHRVAENYFRYETNRQSTLAHVHTIFLSDNNPACYIFNDINKGGFIIIAGDDIAEPVLAYSIETNFDINTKNKAVLSWLEFYKNEIEYGITHQYTQLSDTKIKWQNYESNQFSFKNRAGVQPLCRAKWNQSPHVNDMCPYDKTENKRCVTGCPSTAMSIIMKYHNHPSQGIGSSSYNHTKYGTLSVNYANESYNYSSMPDTVSAANSEVAKIMYHTGVAVEMEYAPNESGAVFLEEESNKKEATCEYAFKKYFGYNSSTVKGVQKKNFTDAVWIAMLKKELDENRPMQYAGYGGGGHTWVCDGYDDNNKFHMNWGWGGDLDGYFALNALQPGAGGIGSGEGHYNNNQQALIGLKPAIQSVSSAPKFGLILKSNIVANPTTIKSNTAFTITVDLNYTGTTTLDADIAASVFTQDGEFVDDVEIKESQSFTNNTTRTYTFTTQGIDLVQGNYLLGIYSAGIKDSAWTLIKKSNFTNPLPFRVEGNPTFLSLASATQLPTTSVIENKDFSILADVKNNGTANFDGFVSADIFDKDGDFLLSIGTPQSVSLSPGQSKKLTFTTQSSTLKQGTYLIGIFETLDKNDFNILSDANFENPVELVVLSTPLTPDAYESNNTSSTAYSLLPNFVNNAAVLTTIGSNLHITSDYDFYSMNLPVGFNYTINARVNDEFNSADGKNYTCNVIFNYKTNTLSSDYYDTQLDAPLKMNNGGLVTFQISPKFVGMTGTYGFNIDISRTPATATNDLFRQSKIEIYPNPATSILTIDRSATSINIIEIILYNSLGQKVLVQSLDDNNNLSKVDVSNFKSGVYFIQLLDNSHNSYTTQCVINN